MKRTRPLDCPDTLPRQGVRLAWGLALALLPLGPLHAAITPEDWAGRDPQLLARLAQTEPERLLASCAGERDTDRLVATLRRLSAVAGAPDWMRREALQALCEYFCVAGPPDSLARRSRELQALGGPVWDCPLLAAGAAAEEPPVQAQEAGDWWVQVGAFSTETAARAALAGLGSARQRRVVAEQGLWKARLGPYESEAAAGRAARELGSRLKEHRLVRVKP
jgi:hypothetical protein